MKLRNVRRRQWTRYIDRLDRLDRESPQREAPPHSFQPGLSPIQTWSPGYSRFARREAHRWMLRKRNEWSRTNRWVEHDCVWVPADLPINAAGDTRPGFECTYQLENGTGRCESNVFDINDVVGKSACIVRKGGPGW